MLTLLPLFSVHVPASPTVSPLSLHDALPISRFECNPRAGGRASRHPSGAGRPPAGSGRVSARAARSEEHTSELQSLTNLVCRLLLEKKKKKNVPASHV